MQDDLALKVGQAQQLILQHMYYPPAQTAADPLSEAAIRAMFKESGDPRAEYISPQLAKRYPVNETDQGAGIGIKAQVRDGRFIVTAVHPGKPADQAGLKIGDRFLSLDGHPIR